MPLRRCFVYVYAIVTPLRMGLIMFVVMCVCVCVYVCVCVCECMCVYVCVCVCVRDDGKLTPPPWAIPNGWDYCTDSWKAALQKKTRRHRCRPRHCRSVASTTQANQRQPNGLFIVRVSHTVEYIDIQTDRRTDRQTRQTYRQTDRRTDGPRMDGRVDRGT